MSEQYPLRKNKTPWPTKKAMEQVYEMKLWGSGAETFYSGDGSHAPEIVEPYQQVVISFLKSFITPITVCDFGCGDFNIGKDFVKYTKHYKAVDIVAPLIEHNQQKYQTENLTFYCLDLAVDELPKGDCAIVRQVLQHLSNKEVQAILQKLQNFKYVILTEHIPVDEFVPNQDIIDIASECNTPIMACKKIVDLSYAKWLEYENRTDEFTLIVMYLRHMEK